MKNLLFVILILIILAAIGAVVYFWRQADAVKNTNDMVVGGATPSTASHPQETPEVLPSGATVELTPSYQKPAENAVIKFPIFNYHHIRPMPSVASSTISDRAFTVSPEGFEAHLKYFQDNGYQVVSIYDLLDYFDTGRPLPKKAVAITFDDGYYGQYQWAYPLLKKYGVSAAFFIIVNNVGQPGVLTWEEI
ncbi:polysaccharide deacetylase family protein, partial [Patescibacteria group bacterium]|nr:polysaccharide deacetylase family protein [Patescibacteria group bacterium]